MYDQVVKCQRAGLCLSEHFLINFVDWQVSSQPPSDASNKLSTLSSVMICLLAVTMVHLPANRVLYRLCKVAESPPGLKPKTSRSGKSRRKAAIPENTGDVVAEKCVVVLVLYLQRF